MKKKIIAIILSMLLVLALFSSCHSKSTSDVIRFPISSDPICLDPQIAVGTSANILINNCFEGLVRIGEGGNIIPGVAKSWKVSSDSLTYTFNLRSNAHWILPKDLEDTLGKDYEKTFDTNVKAKDFVFAFTRSIDPITNAPNARDIYAIKNAKAINTGKMPTNKLGVTALDDYTLQITLDYANLNFLSVLATPICMPCNETFFNKTLGRYGLSSRLLLCNGPFYLSNWEKESMLYLKANENYEGDNTVLPTNVNLYVSPDNTTHLQKLISGTYDAAHLSSSDVSALPSDMQFETTKYKNIVWSLCFNNTSTLLSNNDLRLALFHSTNGDVFKSDSNAIVEGIVPSSCLIFPGSSYRANSNIVSPSNYDTTLASKYWNSYIQNGNSAEVTLSLLCTKEHETMVKKLIQEWQKLFGIEFSVSIVTMEEYELQKRVCNGNYELAFAPIFADEFLASDFLNRFGTGNYGNVANYSSATYDSLLESIQKATSKKELLNLCKDAETHLMNNGIIFPVYFEDSYVVVSSNVEGLYFYPSGENVSFLRAHHTK
ncbi:MAG: peptide ABC transporter substrate-binding protein [Clostridia bacterium]|nr:peptide ABC transporter substrate-binding protein [Clostridia bacterium]